jgi:hypothetical protein
VIKPVREGWDTTFDHMDATLDALTNWGLGVGGFNDVDDDPFDLEDITPARRSGKVRMGAEADDEVRCITLTKNVSEIVHIELTTVVLSDGSIHSCRAKCYDVDGPRVFVDLPKPVRLPAVRGCTAARLTAMARKKYPTMFSPTVDLPTPEDFAEAIEPDAATTRQRRQAWKQPRRPRMTG